MEIIDSYILTFLIFFPLGSALFTLLLPSLSVVRWFSIGSAIVSFFASLHLWFYFDPTTPGLQFTEQYEWIPQFGISYLVGIDGINLLIVLLTTFLTPLIILSQWHIEDKKQKWFFTLLLALESTMIGALVALDLVFFYIFWEAMLIPMYFIIGIWGGKRRIYATTKFFIFTFVGSLLMLAAALVLYHLHTSQTGTPSTNLLDLYRAEISPDTQFWMFLAFAIAFAIKVPLWPFHTWLPDAHVEAPTAGSVVLAGVLLKMGTYGFIRFAIPLFPEATVTFAPVLMGLGITGIIYGALVAWQQKDAKKIVAYSSVSHLGYVVIGSIATISGGVALSEEAMTGAVYQMINHGISTGALFFLVGIIYEKRHTRMLEDFGGLAKVMPWYAVILIVATLSSVGLPGTGGFVGEFLILIGVFQSSPFAGILASIGVLLGAIYMLTLCKAILFGPIKHEENKTLKDLNKRELGYLAPLAILAILMGIYPSLFLDKIQPSIKHLAQNFKNYNLVVIDRISSSKNVSTTPRVEHELGDSH